MIVSCADSHPSQIKRSTSTIWVQLLWRKRQGESIRRMSSFELWLFILVLLNDWLRWFRFFRSSSFFVCFRQIAIATGPCGNNRDYLFRLEKAMYNIGEAISDFWTRHAWSRISQQILIRTVRCFKTSNLKVVNVLQTMWSKTGLLLCYQVSLSIYPSLHPCHGLYGFKLSLWLAISSFGKNRKATLLALGTSVMCPDPWFGVGTKGWLWKLVFQ